MRLRLLPKPIRRWLKQWRKARKEHEREAREQEWARSVSPVPSTDIVVGAQPQIPEVMVDPVLKDGVLVVPEFKKMEPEELRKSYGMFVKSLANIEEASLREINERNASYNEKAQNRWNEYGPEQMLFDSEVRKRAKDVLGLAPIDPNHKPDECPMIGGFCSICDRSLGSDYEGRKLLPDLDATMSDAARDDDGLFLAGGKPVKKLTGQS